MTQIDKSIISQITLDSSKIDQTVRTEVLAPLHAGHSSYAFYKYRSGQQKLPFGSTASRITQQLASKQTSHVVGYTPVYSKVLETTLNSPFGYTSNRFNSPSSLSPGPATYNSQLSIIKHKTSNTIFPKTSKIDKPIQNSIGPGTYNIEDKQKPEIQLLRQKIRQKFKENKQKYMADLVKNNKRLNRQKLLMTMGSQPNKDYRAFIQEAKPAKKIVNQDTSFNRFLLRESTQKYVGVMQSDNLFQGRENACQISKNFTSVFIERKDDVFQSYIPKIQDCPGPGYYLRQDKPPLLPTNLCGSSFRSGVIRQLFGPMPIIAKPKPKLSHLL